MEEKFVLKDFLFSPEKVQAVSERIKEVFPEFDEKNFKKDIVEKFPELELKQRISHMANMLKKYLPSDYTQATEILLASLPPILDPSLTDGDFWDFIYAPYGEFVAQHAKHREYLDWNFYLLEEITKRFSVEFAVRDFFVAFPSETLQQMKMFAKHPNYHVRRLASEGSRSSLPWGKKIPIEHYQTQDILRALVFDPTRYVTRSVANHLNDISKKNPDFVMDFLANCRPFDDRTKKEMDFVIRHALRNLIKSWHPRALEMIGIQTADIWKVCITSAQTSLVPGEYFVFECGFESLCDQEILMDYTIHFLLANGKYSKKVHKIGRFFAQKKSHHTISKKHRFQHYTTRTLYSGMHKIEVSINGKSVEEVQFEIKNAL